MIQNKANKRHQDFKTELRAYHDSINRKNKYSLPKLSGKLNVFEAAFKSDSDEKENKESESDNAKKYEIVRTIPNTALTIISDGVLKGIGDTEGHVIVYPKYGFIQGAMGENNKLVPCIMDDGKIDYFDINSETINECEVGGGIGVTTTGGATAAQPSDDYHEIDYDKVKKDLTIPFLCGYRIKDMRTGRLMNKGVKRRKRKRK